MKVTEINQTSEEMPAQWHGHLKDGRMFYGRYSWGCLKIYLSTGITDDVDEAMTDMVFNQVLNHEHDNFMSTDTFKENAETIGFEF